MTSRVLVVLAVVACLLHCGESRSVVLQTNDDKPVPEAIPKVHVGADGVSASFGGYSASAGLGGALGGSPGAAGGLYARAGTPDGTGAAAGLGGSLNPGGQPEGGLYAGAGVGGGAGGSSTSNSQGTYGHKIRPGTTLYNDIFNIPTSILGAVNRLLNGGVAAVSNVSGVSAGAEVGTGTKPGFGAHAHAGVSAGNGGAGGGIRTSTGFFNDIFNIPITALNAVNQLLNNKSGGK